MAVKHLNESVFVLGWAHIAEFNSCSRQINKGAATKIKLNWPIHWGSNKKRYELTDGNSTTKVISVCS